MKCSKNARYVTKLTIPESAVKSGCASFPEQSIIPVEVAHQILLLSSGAYYMRKDNKL